MPDEIATMDFNDTFLDIDHLKSSFPGCEIRVDESNPEKLVRPFKVTFQDVSDKSSKKRVITVEPHVPPSRGPYKANEPKK